MITDLLDEVRSLDPAAGIATLAPDRTARAAVHAATQAESAPVPVDARARWFGSVPRQLAYGQENRPAFAANTLPLLAKAALVLGVILTGTTFGLIFTLILRGPGVRPSLGVLGALGALIGVPLGRRLGRPIILAILAMWSIAGILAFTVVAELPRLRMTPAPWAWPGLRSFFYSPGWSDLTQWTVFPHGPLKVLLYLPAGLLLTALTGRPGRVVVALVALSLTVDVVRTWATRGFGSNGNVIAETIGAVLGVGLALALRKLLHRARATPAPPTDQ